MNIDPVTLEILWTRLIQVTNEQAAALMRTSFTPIVREVGDLSAAVFDARGRMLAQAVTGTPGHINSLATGMRHFLAAHPPETLDPGDVLITNDPWMTSGQLNDLSVVTPVFREVEGSPSSRLIGFFGNTCHAIDIGGRGLSADAGEVYEEGLAIPIMKLEDRGEPNRDLLRLLAANVRAPEEVLGDLHAQVAGNQVGAERLLAYLDEMELPDLEAVGAEILDRSERAMRDALGAIPDGDYERTCFVDGLEAPIRIHCRLSVRDDSVTADFAGSSDQVERGLNVVLNYTAAYTNYALKCAVAPDVPHNDGSFRPVRVIAPEGSIFNPRFPAAVAARQIAGHYIPHAVFGALEEVLPGRVIAEGAGGIWLTTVRGAGAKRFVSVFFSAGGTGARPTADGLSTTAFPSGVASSPIEVIETTGPLVIRRKELRRDSGGPGRRRGGLGQVIDVEVRTGEPYVVSTLSDRFTRAADGYSGGGAGARAGFRASTGVRRSPKLSMTMPAGATFTLELPGGGGYFDALERPLEEVAEDVAEGLVSPAAAERAYGVRVTRHGRVLGVSRGNRVRGTKRE
ncbi:MAG TPA: hydantoinase B/oxoprolinase family protein [Candidatus Dormibacteraeota bacterium]|nr:hydantoinase B/oxoprolinase family protein [Candidatus Dormibacteraeota bacterium]